MATYKKYKKYRSFSTIIPDHRLKAVEKAIDLRLDRKDLQDSFTEEMWVLYEILVEQAKEQAVIAQDPTSIKGYTLLAYTIYEDDAQSAILESLLLTNAEHQVISDTFAIPLVTVSQYEKLFFDKDSFNTKLGILSYIDDLEEGMHKELKRRAYTLGSDFVLYKYGNVLPSTKEQKELLKRLFLDSAYRAMEANYASVTSSNNKAALEWSKIMLKASESLERVFSDDGNNTDTLMIHLVDAQDRKLAMQGGIPQRVDTSELIKVEDIV